MSILNYDIILKAGFMTLSYLISITYINGGFGAGLSASGLAIADLAVALRDPPNSVIFFAGAVENAFRLFELVGGNTQQHAKTHFKSAHHVILGNVPQLRHGGKKRQHRPGIIGDGSGSPLGQPAGEVLSDATASDVRHGGN